MTEYYIRISDEKPLDYDESIYFKLDCSGDDKEFYAVRKNSYNKLVDDFNEINNAFNNKVNSIVDSYLANKSIGYCDNAYNIINKNLTSKFSYDDINNIKTLADSNKERIDDIEDITDDLEDTIKWKINNSLTPSQNAEVEAYKTNHPNDVINHLNVFDNDFFVFAQIHWKPKKGVLAPYKTRQKNSVNNKVYPYYMKDIFHYALPESLRPYRDTGFMNSFHVDMTKKNTNSDGYSNIAEALKIVVRKDGTIDLINLSDHWINSNQEGYGIQVNAMWAKGNKFSATTDNDTGTEANETDDGVLEES